LSTSKHTASARQNSSIVERRFASFRAVRRYDRNASDANAAAATAANPKTPVLADIRYADRERGEEGRSKVKCVCTAAMDLIACEMMKRFVAFQCSAVCVC